MKVSNLLDIISCNLHKTYNFAESGISKKPNVYGDLVLSKKQKEQLVNNGEGTAQATFAGAVLWPNKVMPYVLDFNISK